MNLWFKLCLKLPYFWSCKIHKAIHSLFVTSLISVICVFTDALFCFLTESILNNRQSKGQSQVLSLPILITFISPSSRLYLSFYSSFLSPLFPTFQPFHSSKIHMAPINTTGRNINRRNNVLLKYLFHRKIC